MMNSSIFFRATFGVLICTTLVLPRRADAVDFAHEVVPVLKRNCIHCHGGREAEGGFSLNSRQSVMASGFVDLDTPDASHVLELITTADPDLRMPPADRPAMSQQDVEVLQRWIQAGLPWEPGFTFALETYEPPLRPRTPELPPIQDGRSNPIDRILDHDLESTGLDRPEPIDDATFLRRVSLDLIGLLPTEKQLSVFLQDPRPDKRTQVIDALLADDIGYADHWITFFNDLLRNDYSGTGFITGGRRQISHWLYEALLSNKPFNQLASELIAPPSDDSRGYIDGIKWRGEVSAGQTLPIQFSQSVSQSFLGINMKCASCHDSFTDRWTLKDAYGLAAIYAGEPLELHRCDKPTGELAEATWLFPELGNIDAKAPTQQRLQQLASLMTHPENGRFARTIVNRLWYQMMGRGVVHPLDAMQTEPWNEDLLDFLAVDFVENGYDLKATLKRIASSSAYQSKSEVLGEQSLGDDYVYRGPRAKRMTAEQFIDGIWQLTGSAPQDFDAPVSRGVVTADQHNQPQLAGQWIWGPNQNGVAPGQHTVVLRKRFELNGAVDFGAVIITCDNVFDLYVNDAWVLGSDDWTKPKSVVLSRHLRSGENTLHVIVKNEASTPNPAGMFLEGLFKLQDGSQVKVQSDATWQFNPNAPTPDKRRLSPIPGDWLAASLVPELPVWRNVVATAVPPFLSRLERGDGVPMVRASLMKNTALMKSLGRPMREQIVSMRPDTLTTLEAIDLANEMQLADAFALGAERMLERYGHDIERLIESLFAAALARSASPEEMEIMKDTLGAQPDATTIQDAMWAVCMLPEFILIR